MEKTGNCSLRCWAQKMESKSGKDSSTSWTPESKKNNGLKSRTRKSFSFTVR
jgi:hypothetical protein